MDVLTVSDLAEKFHNHGIRYLIVGGFAVVAHGYLRYTGDVDFVLAMDPPNLNRAITVFESLGYKPRAPVQFSQFAVAENRAMWARDKHMLVFSLLSPDRPLTEVDLFLEPPFDFDPAYERSKLVELSPGKAARVCSLSDLLSLKKSAGRPKDLIDIDALNKIHPVADSTR